MEENKSSVGSIVGTIIIIALLVLGGLYFWGKRIEESKALNQLTSDNVTPTAQTDSASINEATAIKSMSSSDELGAIEVDLKNTNTTNLSPELEASVQ